MLICNADVLGMEELSSLPLGDRSFISKTHGVDVTSKRGRDYGCVLSDLNTLPGC